MKLEYQIQRLQKSLDSFCEFTSVPVTIYSKQHEIVWESNKVEKYCVTNESYMNTKSVCRKKLAAAMDNAAYVDGVSLFFCKTGLINAVYAYKYLGSVVGYVVAGPIAAGNNRDAVIQDFYTRVVGEKLDMPLLLSMTNDLKVYSMGEINSMSKVFFDVVNSARVYDGFDGNYCSNGMLCEKGMLSQKKNEFEFIDSVCLNYYGNSSVIHNAMAYLHSNYTTIVKIDEIADYVKVSKTYLSALFKKETGTAIVTYLNNLRLEAAAFRLKTTDYSITEIALAVGYKEISYFSKLFSEKYGVSPRRYREKQTKKYVEENRE